VSLEILLKYCFRPNSGPGVFSAYNRKKYEEYFLVEDGVGVVRRRSVRKADNLTTFMCRLS